MKRLRKALDDVFESAVTWAIMALVFLLLRNEIRGEHDPGDI